MYVGSLKPKVVEFGYYTWSVEFCSEIGPHTVKLKLEEMCSSPLSYKLLTVNFMWSRTSMDTAENSEKGYSPFPTRF